MLSQQTIDVIKSTVPVLEVHGEAITRHFYQTMFTAHPELLNIFNHANQKQGRQQAALANMVYTAAMHIDNLGAILPAVRQVAHKHRSLGIVPEQYRIVGTYLLQAIKDVLGDAATEEILTAWGDAYQVIADAFIGIEQEMYSEAANQTGGWDGFRLFQVAKKVQESEVITSFYLLPEDGKSISSYQPGQYISIRMQVPGQQFTQIRQYTLSDAPGKPYYRISVKRESGAPDRPDGVISNYLHDHITEGSLVELSAPAGDFTLDMEDQRPIVLVSGGVGLTPMISMLNALTESGDQRPVTFLHASPNGQAHAFRDHVNRLAQEHTHLMVHFCYTAPSDADLQNEFVYRQGYMDAAWLRQVIQEPDANYYLCGSAAFMRSVYAELLSIGAASDRIHYEFFGPKASLSPAAENV
ncbi:NO-inducible flavohemoprotein [Paenibacillus sp. FSL R7-0652]|uniref:NO-inducible flavohemoprotein n=1 Tax=Paenibacillus sp. FSL R7-0652 TaxID=2921687 RepID=UPI00315A285F